MTSFYICRPLQTVTHSQNQHITVLDASSACKVLRKAAIKVHELHAKIEISKVIRFLENLQINCQKNPEKILQSQESVKPEQSLVQLALNEYGDQDQRSSNIMQINTSQSLNGSIQLNELPQEKSIYKKLGNNILPHVKSERPNIQNKENWNNVMQNFRYKQVGIKKELNQDEGNRKVTFKDGSIYNILDKQKYLQLLKQENKILKNTILDIFHFFHSKQLLDLSSSFNQLQLPEIQRLSKILLGTFEKREAKLEFERKKMMQVQSQYLTTLKNISIEQRLQVGQSKPNQTSIVFTGFGNIDPPAQNLNLSTRAQEFATTTNSKVQQLKKQLYQSQERLKQKQEQIKKYQMLLFIKQQQISSLRVLNSDLENKLNKLNKIEERPLSTRANSHKKDLEQMYKNMSSTFS